MHGILQTGGQIAKRGIRIAAQVVLCRYYPRMTMALYCIITKGETFVHLFTETNNASDLINLTVCKAMKPDY